MALAAEAKRVSWGQQLASSTVNAARTTSDLATVRGTMQSVAETVQQLVGAGTLTAEDQAVVAQFIAIFDREMVTLRDQATRSATDVQRRAYLTTLCGVFNLMLDAITRAADVRRVQEGLAALNGIDSDLVPSDMAEISAAISTFQTGVSDVADMHIAEAAVLGVE